MGDRLRAAAHEYPYTILVYPEAGHGLGSFVPYQPNVRDDARQAGATPAANQQARASLWPHVLGLLTSGTTS
jgi:hypothetical protein